MSIRVQGQDYNTSTKNCSGGCASVDEVTCFIDDDSTFSVSHICSGGGGGEEELECIPECSGEQVCFGGLCGYTPVVLDVLGDGFNLTNGINGIDFDFNDDGVLGRLSWTAFGSDDAWLVYDRNGNGLIDSGSELFGSTTPQPPPPVGEIRNGFLALAEYDKRSHGGNGDGAISSSDLIFTRLRLWQDKNHNGISESKELLTLAEVKITSIEVDYRESRRVDEHGNQFRYRTKVTSGPGGQVGRWALDVFLVTP